MKHTGQQQQEIAGVFSLDGGRVSHQDTKKRQKLTGAPTGERGEALPGLGALFNPPTREELTEDGEASFTEERQ